MNTQAPLLPMTVLDRLLSTAPRLEIWWDSSPLVYQSWMKKLIANVPQNKQTVLTEQLLRLFDPQNPQKTLFTGVTTNPPLSLAAINDNPERWAGWIDDHVRMHPDQDARQVFWALYKEIIQLDTAGKDVARDGKESGEIIVRAPWLTPGYYKDPDKSEELWADGWLHTGDVANMNESGYVQIVDRLKDVIKSGGEWIVSLELENLLSLHEGVLEAAVIGIHDEKWGERPQAIVVAREGYKDQLTADDLKAHLTRYVTEGVITNWSVPESYVFVDEIPKTSVGKIDKKVLRNRFA